MTPRERIKKAISFQEPDRVPIDIGGTKVTGIHVDEYIVLGNYLGIDIELPRVYDQRQMLARVEMPMLKWLHSDVVQVENPIESWNLLENKNWNIWHNPTGNRVLMPGNFNPVTDKEGYIHVMDTLGNSLGIMAPTGLYFDNNSPTSPSSGDFILMDPEKWKKSLPLYSEEELRLLEKRAKFLYENTDYSIHGGFLRGGLGRTALFAGHTIGDWLCILLMEKEYAFSILQATAERAVDNLKLYLQAVGNYIDTILISGSDFGTQNGELFSPEIFRKLHLPNYKIINDYVHENCQAKTMFHSCGSIWNLIESFIESGVDILNPVHTNTKNMEPERLVKQYGGRIVFWGGGIETQTVLPEGTTREVEAQVIERIGTFAPGGGFVFAAVHNIQSGVPPENVEAMVKAVITHGNYPIRKEGEKR